MTDLYSWVCGECDHYHACVAAVPVGQAGDRLQVRCAACGHVTTIHEPAEDGQQAAMRRGAQ